MCDVHPHLKKWHQACKYKLFTRTRNSQMMNCHLVKAADFFICFLVLDCYQTDQQILKRL